MTAGKQQDYRTTDKPGDIRCYLLHWYPVALDRLPPCFQDAYRRWPAQAVIAHVAARSLGF